MIPQYRRHAVRDIARVGATVEYLMRGIVQDALKDSRNYREFAENIRQKLSESREATE